MIILLLLYTFSLMAVGAKYDESMAFNALYYSAASYCQKQSVMNWTCGEACDSMKGIRNITKLEDLTRAIFGFVAYSEVHN